MDRTLAGSVTLNALVRVSHHSVSVLHDPIFQCDMFCSYVGHVTYISCVFHHTIFVNDTLSLCKWFLGLFMSARSVLFCRFWYFTTE